MSLSNLTLILMMASTEKDDKDQTILHHYCTQIETDHFITFGLDMNVLD